MKSISDLQVEGTLALQEAEEVMDILIGRITTAFTTTQEDKEELFKKLADFKDLCIKYGRLQSTHEKSLKDVTQIT
jgi:hypothetical protein